jgi:hypothetical protein
VDVQAMAYTSKLFKECQGHALGEGTDLWARLGDEIKSVKVAEPCSLPGLHTWMVGVV